MKYLGQKVTEGGKVTDSYEKRWRGHRVRVKFRYVFDEDGHWDGDEPLPDGSECYGVIVTAALGPTKAEESVWNVWIDPRTEGRNGTNYLFQQATWLLDEAMHHLAKQLASSGHTCKNKLCVVQGVLES